MSRISYDLAGGGHRLHKAKTFLGAFHPAEPPRVVLAIWLGSSRDVRIAGCELVAGLSLGLLLRWDGPNGV